MKKCEEKNTPDIIWEQYESGNTFKSGLGSRGMFEQNKMNERFLVGDQWHGAQCGNDRPLVRHNVIKRIADYKLAVVGSNPVAVNFSADGVPNTLDMKEKIQKARAEQAKGGLDDNTENQTEIPSDDEINFVMSALSDYFRVTAERVKFEDIREQALRNAYTAGTGIVYTWWNDRIRTGLYADENRKTPITGDISCEVLDVENVYFGDPNLDDIQEQPYIIIAQRRSVKDVKREAKRNDIPEEDIEKIRSDNETDFFAGQRSEEEPVDSDKVLVLTKFYKKWDEDGNDYKIKAIRVCKNVTVREEWDLGVRLYPLAKFVWERRRNCIYGDSEVTYLIPNQIAINRMITASVWAVIMMGMPIMIINSDVITQEVTNDPGQVIRVNGGYNDVQYSARYLNPPNFSPNFDNNISSLINNTLTQSGANDAALGDMRPDNTSAIIAVREAATMPLQQVQSRYYSFCEDIARIWAEFWVMNYGPRSLKIEDDNGTWYMPFNGDRYSELLISAKIDIGASTLWSESQSIRTLDNLFDRQVIDVLQYLERLPKGTVPNINKLINEIKATNAAQPPLEGTGGELSTAPVLPDIDINSLLAGLNTGGDIGGNTLAALSRGAENVNAIVPETMPEGLVL